MKTMNIYFIIKDFIYKNYKFFNYLYIYTGFNTLFFGEYL